MEKESGERLSVGRAKGKKDVKREFQSSNTSDRPSRQTEDEGGRQIQQEEHHAGIQHNQPGRPGEYDEKEDRGPAADAGALLDLLKPSNGKEKESTEKGIVDEVETKSDERSSNKEEEDEDRLDYENINQDGEKEPFKDEDDQNTKAIGRAVDEGKFASDVDGVEEGKLGERAEERGVQRKTAEREENKEENALDADNRDSEVMCVWMDPKKVILSRTKLR